jgi:hypothetical protein
VVELKKTQGTDQVVGQILRYMGWVREAYPENTVRGMIIVGKKDDALRYALKATSSIEVKEFRFTLDRDRCADIPDWPLWANCTLPDSCAAANITSTSGRARPN